MPDISNVVHRTRTIELAARLGIPTVYFRAVASPPIETARAVRCRHNKAVLRHYTSPLLRVMKLIQ